MFKKVTEKVQSYGTYAEGLEIFEFDVYIDQRGFFSELYKNSWLNAELKYCDKIVQVNYSYSFEKVFRGLHYQWNPYMGKLVFCITGEIYDYVLDIRRNSKTFGKWFCVKLDGGSRNVFWVPQGFAHGFLATRDSYVLYACSGEYNGNCEAGISPFDEFINIDFSFTGINPKDFIISKKDKTGLTLTDWIKRKDSENFVFGRNC